MLQIRRYQAGEELSLHQLFYQTIRTVNRTDYTESQLQAWAPDDYDPVLWIARIQQINPFVAVLDDVIVGYADVQGDGYIDHFFCHHQYQGLGIGKSLLQHLLAVGAAQGIARFYAQVSLTARPFFENFGFRVLKAQQVEIRGQQLSNFLMEKSVI